MSLSLKDRHLFGAGAAACAVCCAAPLLALLGVGVAGAAATVVTFLFAGAVFGMVVAAGALVAVWNQRRPRRGEACASGPGAVDIELMPRRPARDS